MRVTLADPIITVEGWTHDLDKLGEWTFRRRKTPQEIKIEKEELKARNSNEKVDPELKLPMTCISYDENKQNVVYFLPGLWPRVKKYFDKHKLQYEIVDQRNPDIRPELDMSAFAGVEFRENQDVVVALIAASDCGIIETSTGFGKSFCIALLCKAFPTLNILVTTSSTQVVATLYEYINKTIPGQVGVLYGGRDTTNGKRVVVTTFRSLSNIQHPENVQLMFVDECHGASWNDAGRAIMKFPFCRKFGFSASPIRNDGSGLFMESLFGPTILKMSYQEASDAGMVTPMNYFMLPCNSCPSMARKEGLPEHLLKRWSYWCNDSRNQAIKRLVYGIKEVYDGQILIMVNTLEAAIHLNRLLPWFKVAYYGNVDIKDMQSKFPAYKYPGLDINQYNMKPKQLDIIRNAFSKGTLRYVIATKIFKQGCNFPHLACLIRADGDTSEIEGIQIPGRLSRLDKDKPEVYLIDVMDSFSPWASYRAQARKKQYEAQQWQEVTLEGLLSGLARQSKNNSPEPSGD